MRALIDADLLVYECAFGAENRETGQIYSFESVRIKLDKKIADILDAVGATEHTLFLTGEGNFREDIADSKPYKGNRKQPRPWHYQNTRVYLESLGAVVIDGMEADDAMAIEQMKDYSQAESMSMCNTVICSRDKDLRQVPAYHYGWEVHNQPEYKMTWVDELGEIELVEKEDKHGKIKKSIKGTGLKFFYSQLITGDPTDNIPGLRLGGAILAFNCLNDCTDEQEMFQVCRAAYRRRAAKDHAILDDALDAYVDALMLEMGQLLWMIRELDEEGKPVMWKFPS